MTLSFSLSSSSESLSLVPGVIGEMGSKTAGLPGEDGFSELLNSLASIVPTQGIVSTKTGATAVERQDIQLPGGKDLPVDASALPGNADDDELLGGLELRHQVQSAAILPFTPIAPAVAGAARRDAKAPESASSAEATATKPTTTSNSIPGQARADLPTPASGKSAVAPQSQEIVAPASHPTGDIQVRIGPASELNRTWTAGAAPFANEAKAPSNPFQEALPREGTRDNGRSADVLSRFTTLNAYAEANAGATKPRPADLTRVNSSQVFADPLKSNLRTPSARSADAIVASVNAAVASDTAGEAASIAPAQPIRRASLLTHLSEFKLNSRANAAKAESTSAPQTGLESKPTSPVQTVLASTTSTTKADAAAAQQQFGPFMQTPQAASATQVTQPGPSTQTMASSQPAPANPTASIPQPAPGALPNAQPDLTAQSASIISERSSTETTAVAKGRPETLQSTGGVHAPLVTGPKASPTGSHEKPPKFIQSEAGQTHVASREKSADSKPRVSARASELPAKTAASKADLAELNGAAEKAVIAPRNASSIETTKPLPTAIAAPVDGSFHTARPVSAVTPISTNDPFLNVERVVDQLMTARQLDLSKPTAISVAHREFGALTVTFDQQSTGNMNVEIAAETSEAQRALAAAMANDRGSSRQAEAVTPQSLTQNQATSGAPDRGGMTNGGGSGLGQNSADDQRSQQSDQRGQSGERAAPRHQHQTPSRPDDALYA